MRIVRKLKPTPDVDPVAFSDVAFLLIIFFILTTTFVRSTGNVLELPSGTRDAQPREEKTLTIFLKQDGIFYQGESPSIDLDGLRAELAGARLPERPEKERVVLVESEPDVSCERYFQVVMAIVDNGGVLAMLEE